MAGAISTSALAAQALVVAPASALAPALAAATPTIQYGLVIGTVAAVNPKDVTKWLNGKLYQ